MIFKLIGDWSNIPTDGCVEKELGSSSPSDLVKQLHGILYTLISHDDAC